MNSPIMEWHKEIEEPNNVFHYDSINKCTHLFFYTPSLSSVMLNPGMATAHTDVTGMLVLSPVYHWQ